jgi:hypothetical protein
MLKLRAPDYLAHDVNLSVSELRIIAAKRPDSAYLLRPRLDSFDRKS